MPKRIQARVAVKHNAKLVRPRRTNPSLIPPIRKPDPHPNPNGVIGDIIAHWPRGLDGKVPKNQHAEVGVLIAIAAFAEREIDNPSIRELSSCLPKVPKWLIVESVDRLERHGWLRVKRTPQPHIRNRYVITPQISQPPKRSSSSHG